MISVLPSLDASDWSAAGRNRRRFQSDDIPYNAAAEGDLFAGLNLNWFTGWRIAAHTGRAIPHLQNSESGDLYPLAKRPSTMDRACFLLSWCCSADA